MPPAALMALIARMWCRWPPRTGVPGLEVHAERRAEQRLLGVVHRQGVAGEKHVHVAAPDQLDEVRAAAGVDHDGPRDEGNLQPPLPMCRIIAAMRPTLASTRRSEEISLVMNPKSARVAVAELRA